MSGVVRIKCPTCKQWMRLGDDLCEECSIVVIRSEEE